MTVSLALCQVTSIIHHDTLVCYTKDQNRQLAIWLKEKDKCQIVSLHKDSTIHNLYGIIRTYQKDSIYYKGMLNADKVEITNCSNNLQLCNKKLDVANIKIANKNKWIKGLALSNGIFIVAILIRTLLIK